MVFQVTEEDVKECFFLPEDLGKWAIVIDGYLGGLFNTKEQASDSYYDVWFYLNS